ncbi:UNVERIFIED_ORG: hypothetical protein M2402_001637 [Rahnella aquatilis]
MLFNCTQISISSNLCRCTKEKPRINGAFFVDVVNAWTLKLKNPFNSYN